MIRQPKRRVRTECSCCKIGLVSKLTWETWTPAERELETRRKHAGLGLCPSCYWRLKRYGDPAHKAPYTARPARGGYENQRSMEDTLEEWVMIRDGSGPGKFKAYRYTKDPRSLRFVAERMGMTLSALDQALYRARKAGDSRGSLWPNARPGDGVDAAELGGERHTQSHAFMEAS